MKYSILALLWISLLGLQVVPAQTGSAVTQETIKEEFIKTLTLIHQSSSNNESLEEKRAATKRYNELRASLESRYTPQQLEDTVVDILKESKKNQTIYGQLALDFTNYGNRPVNRRQTIDWLKQDLLENFQNYGEGATRYASHITHYGNEQDLEVLRQIIALIPVQTNIVNSPTKHKEESLQSLRGSLRNIVSATEYKFKKQREEAAAKAAPEAPKPATPMTHPTLAAPKAAPPIVIKEVVAEIPFSIPLWAWGLLSLLGLAGAFGVWRMKKRYATHQPFQS